MYLPGTYISYRKIIISFSFETTESVIVVLYTAERIRISRQKHIFFIQTGGRKMDEEKNENIPYDPDINHIVDTTIWEEESYGFEEEEHDHEELISSLTALGTGVLVFGEMVEGMDRVFQTIDDILDGVDSILDDWLS